MSKKKGISVESLSPSDKEGYLTKQGGSVKTWKKRWFVLKGNRLYYFKSRKDQDVTGIIELTKDSFVKKEEKKKKYCFAVATSKRVFFMYPDTQTEQQEWLDKLDGVVSELKNPSKNHGTPSSPTNSVTSSLPPTVSTGGNEPGAGAIKGPRDRLGNARVEIPFLQDEDSKVLEFWQIWADSHPVRDDIQPGGNIEFEVATAADMQKLTWRTHGPQNIFIQKMVDFFWNVGAPETEIDRLNDIGALINPVTIGSWIDMSAKGGMDGGWFFPVNIPIKFALEASDPGDPTKKVAEWAETHQVNHCFAVGRDMGAAPPRQTEIKFKMTQPTYEEQLACAVSAFEAFGFPALSQEAIDILRSNPKEGICLSVITSSEGFVRLGLLAPKPDAATVSKLCSFAGASNTELLARFETALGVDGPEYAEYQYLMKGFGYGVYKEGFDVVFHYHVGEETAK